MCFITTTSADNDESLTEAVAASAFAFEHNKYSLVESSWTVGIMPNDYLIIRSGVQWVVVCCPLPHCATALGYYSFITANHRNVLQLMTGQFPTQIVFFHLKKLAGIPLALWLLE